MKLLFENWRGFLNESAGEEEIKAMITDEFSFNLAANKDSQHRWGVGRPVIDYPPYDDKTPTVAKNHEYIAYFPVGSPTHGWDWVGSEKDEGLGAFLARVEKNFERGGEERLARPEEGGPGTQQKLLEAEIQKEFNSQRER